MVLPALDKGKRAQLQYVIAQNAHCPLIGVAAISFNSLPHLDMERSVMFDCLF